MGTHLNTLKTEVDYVRSGIRYFPEQTPTDRTADPLSLYYGRTVSAVQIAKDLGLIDVFDLARRGWVNGNPSTADQARQVLDVISRRIREKIHVSRREETLADTGIHAQI